MDTKNNISDENKKENGTKPDEKSNIYATSHIKIFDPETNKIYVNMRGDN